MLRHLTNGIALALFVCLAIGFGFLEGASYKAQQSIHSDQRAAHDQKESGPEAPSFAPIRLIFGSDGVAKYCDASTENNKRNWAHKYICDIRITDVYIALFTLLLTFVTGGLIYVGYLQWADSRILQRAYISVEPSGINPFISDDGSVYKEILGHVNFVNVGRLPARDISVGQPNIVWSARQLEEEDLVLELLPPMNIVLPPGTKMPLGTASYSPEHLGGTGYLYVWGNIRYTDGFGKRRFTKFCHRYPCQPIELAADGSKRIDAKHARYHQYGNDAD